MTQLSLFDGDEAPEDAEPEVLTRNRHYTVMVTFDARDEPNELWEALIEKALREYDGDYPALNEELVNLFVVMYDREEI